MANTYFNIYNSLIRLSTNKDLYRFFKYQDTFNDRLIFFLLHFAFFLKVYKNEENSKLLQEIYDFNFRQLELSIREIGYGDQSINKKMKDYINLFHSIINEIHYWDTMNKKDKKYKLQIFLTYNENIDWLLAYFDSFCENLKKKKIELHFKRCN